LEKNKNFKKFNYWLFDLDNTLYCANNGIFDQIYNRRWDEMVKAQSTEMGAPLDYASETHTKMGADISKNTIKILKDFNFEHQFDPKSNNLIRYEPIGVCGVIKPIF